MKGIYFDQSSSPVLSEPTLRLIVAVAEAYDLTIGIVVFTNALYNILKDSSEHDIIDFLTHSTPTICIEPAPDGHYVMEICCEIQGTKTSGRQ